MLKLEIKLDEDKINKEQKYRISRINQTLSQYYDIYQ